MNIAYFNQCYLRIFVEFTISLKAIKVYLGRKLIKVKVEDCFEALIKNIKLGGIF